MKIEDIIKATKVLDISKKTILNIIYTQSVISENLNEILKPFDLSLEQYNVLRILRGQHRKPLNMSDIQDRMLSKNSNTTRLVDKLLLKNRVSRCECSSNRRKIEVSLTNSGLDLLNNLDNKIDLLEQRFADKLSLSELENLNFLLEKYRN